MLSRVLQVFLITMFLCFGQVSAAAPQVSINSSDTITYFPDTDWASTTPEEQGMDSATLDELIQYIDDTSAPVRGLIITRNGYIVREQYWNYYTENTSHQIFSATKSFTGTLIGIALREGFIDNVSQRVVDFFPMMTIQNMDSRKGNMTLEHVLTMTTGLDWNEWNISYDDPTNMYQQMFTSPNPIQFFLDLPTAYEPGTHWVYTTGASHLLSAIVTATTGMSARDFAEQYLFEPLNMTIGGWNVDPQGINNGGTQLYVSTRAMAKLGLLYLNNGTWDGQELLTEDYVTEAATPHATIEPGVDYGYQWWLHPTNGYFSAEGSEGQYIVVAPDYNVVVAITAHADEPGEDISNQIIQFVLESILTGPTDGAADDTGFLQIAIVGGSVLLVACIAVLYRRRS